MATETVKQLLLILLDLGTIRFPLGLPSHSTIITIQKVTAYDSTPNS